MFFLVLWGLGIVTAVIDLYMKGFPSDPQLICSVILLHQFVVTFGLLGITGLLSNMIFAKQNAKMVGWPGGPFQIKYGFSQLGLGIMGVMCIWFRDGFWLGTIVAMYIYGISGLWSHWNVMKMNKKADADSIANIIMDIAYQTFITVLSIVIGGIWVIG